MRVTVLAENTTSNPHLIAEHGLSLYIESGGVKLLFDTGQSDVALVHNAMVLGVDLSAVDFAVLSHGHYDHGGGLQAFLQENRHAVVYLQGRAFGEYYNASDRYIGLEPALRLAEHMYTVGDVHELNEHMILCACNEEPLLGPIEPMGLAKKVNGVMEPDDFLHEHYLIIREGGKKYLISGCSHKGVYNLVLRFQPDVFIGGMHLSAFNPDDGVDAGHLDSIAARLLQTKTRFYTCHCTGVQQYAYLRDIMHDRIHYIAVGDTLQITP